MRKNISADIWFKFLFSLIVTMLLNVRITNGQLYYEPNSVYRFQGTDYRSSVKIEEVKGQTFFLLSIINQQGKQVYSQRFKQEDYSNFWLKEPFSFYNSVGIIGDIDGGDYYFDFISKKKILIVMPGMRESYPFGDYITVVTNNFDFQKKINSASLNVYDQHLNLIRKIKLPNKKKNEFEEYYKSDRIEKTNTDGSIVTLKPKIERGETYILDPNMSYIGYNAKEDFFFNPFNNKKETLIASNNPNNTCPENFQKIDENNIIGTARKYKTKDGNYFYEVKLKITPSQLTQKYTTQIKSYRYRNYDKAPRLKDLGLERQYKVLNASSGTITFTGCLETDLFRIEGIYSCQLFRQFKGPSADIYFRDLKIIQ